MKLLVLILLLLIIHSNSIFGQIEKALAEKVIELKTTQPVEDYSDLKQLAPFLNGKRIVSLGEASHGTSEFFSMKHRLLEYLVKEQGFRLFAIESNFTSMLPFNDYLLEGKGDLLDLVKKKFGVWKTEEVLAMLKWMRNYNLTCKIKDQVKFYGFDMQTSFTAFLALKSFIKETDPSLHAYLETSYHPAADSVLQVLNPVDSLDILKIKKSLAVNKDKLIKVSSLKAWQIQEQNATLLQQHYTRMQFYTKSKDKSSTSSSRINNHYATYAQRELGMATNVKWILDHEGKNSKIVLWAHNAHVSEGGDLLMRNVGAMGSYLSEWFKDQYYSIGFDTYEGKYNGYRNNQWQVVEWPKATQDHFAFIAEKINKPVFFLDFQHAGKDPLLRDWLNASLLIRQHYGDHKGNFRSYFDSIIFIKSTNPSKRL